MTDLSLPAEHVESLLEPTGKNDEKPPLNIWLISSCIHTVSDPVIRGYTRSIFSPQERLAQTLETIRSIKAKCPNSFCVLMETSKLTPEDLEALKACDRILDFSQEGICGSLAHRAFIDKGIIELYTLYMSLRALTSAGITADYFFKISGRYYLQDDFDPKSFQNPGYTFRKFSNSHHSWYSTMIFSVNGQRVQEYLDILFRGLAGLSNQVFIDIEFSFSAQLPPEDSRVTLVERLHGAGRTSVDGTLAEH